MTRVGPHDIPLVSEPRCRVCQFPQRIEIENQILQGLSWRGLEEHARTFPTGHLDHPTVYHLKKHWEEGHMPIQAALQRRMIERRAEEIGDSFDDKYAQMVDAVVVSEAILSKGFNRLNTGEIEPTVAETLAAAKQLHDLKKDQANSIDQQVWLNAMARLFEVVKGILTDDQWLAFGQLCLNDPILSAMARELTRTVDSEARELT